MKSKKSLLFLLTLCTVHASEEPLHGITFFSPRSQGTNSAQLLLQWHELISYEDIKQQHTHNFFATLSYSQSFKAQHISQALFGAEDITIAGSQVIDRPFNALVADYFGLSPLFQSTVQLKPHIRNGILDLNMVLCTDRLLSNTYVTIRAPWCWSRWSLGLRELVSPESQNTPFPAGYQNATDQPLAPSATSFVDAAAQSTSFGSVEGKKKGLMVDHKTQNKIADIHVAAGWRPIDEEYRGLLIELLVTAPTGTRPKSTILFEPIVGNGHHWQLGTGIMGYSTVWEEIEQLLNIYVYVQLSHLFGATQQRSFDLKNNGFGSRYLLLKKFESDGTFNGTVVPAVNITTLKCKVKNWLQADGSIMFGYTKNNFTATAGYNGWIRSKEKISLKKTIQDKTYGIKGIQNVFDVAVEEFDDRTESTATLFNGNFADQAANADPTPVFISTADIDIKSAASPLLITHKLFGSIGFCKKIDNPAQTLPFWALGGEIEFEGVDNRTVEKPFRTTMSQWRFFIQGGVTF